MTTSIGKKLRLGKIFAKDGRSLILAYDHRLGQTGTGLVDPGKTIDAIVEGGADAIMTTIGVIRQHYEKMAGRLGVIIRADCVESKYVSKEQRALAWPQFVSIETAVMLGCDAIIDMAILGAPNELKALEFAAKLANECEKYGMPLAHEFIPSEAVGESLESVLQCCQLSEEFGGDMVKTHWPGSKEAMKEAISTVKIPVLLAGGVQMATPRDYLELIDNAFDAGIRGVFCGRNIFRYKDPGKMTRAIAMIMHEGATVSEALSTLGH